MKNFFDKAHVENSPALHKILDAVNEGFFFLDTEWKIVFMNRSAYNFIRPATSCLIGTNLWDLFPREEHEFFYAQYSLAIESGEPVSFEVYYPPYKKWIAIKAYPAVNGLAVHFQDITESKELVNELNIQKKRLEVLYNKGADMVGIVNMHGVYQFVSSNVERIFGYKAEEMIGLNGFDFIHPDDVQQVAEKLQLLLNSDEVLMNEFRFRDKAGNWRWVEVLGTNMLNEPLINGIIINSREITSWKEKDQQLRKAFQAITLQNEKLREIAFIQSHEVRRPVANILSLLEVLDKIAVAEKDKPVLEMLRRSIQQLDEMIHKIVSLTFTINELTPGVSEDN